MLTPFFEAVAANGFKQSNLKTSILESAVSSIDHEQAAQFRAMLIANLMCATSFEVFEEAIQRTLATFHSLQAGR